MIEEILEIVRSLQQQQGMASEKSHEIIQAAIDAVRHVAAPKGNLSGTITGTPVTRGNLGTSFYGRDPSDKADNNTKS